MTRNLDPLNELLARTIHARASFGHETGASNVLVEGIRFFDISEQWLKAVRAAVYATDPGLVYEDYWTESAGQSGGMTYMHARFSDPTQQ